MVLKQLLHDIPSSTHPGSLGSLGNGKCCTEKVNENYKLMNQTMMLLIDALLLSAPLDYKKKEINTNFPIKVTISLEIFPWL